MSLVWIPLVALFAVLLIAAAGVALALFSPLVFILDSGSRELRFCWLWLVRFRAPLPGGAGEAALSVAGKRLRVRFPKAPKKKPLPKKDKRRTRPPVAFAWRLLRNPGIRRRMAAQLGRLAKRLLRSFRLAQFRGNIALTDPALNGMLAGVLAQSRWGRAARVRVNFTGDDSLFCEVRLYPYRIFTALAYFVFGLPYRAIWRQWRFSLRPKTALSRTF